MQRNVMTRPVALVYDWLYFTAGFGHFDGQNFQTPKIHFKLFKDNR